MNDKQARLEAARTALKAHFVGIDPIIDGLIDHIRLWYLMPEVLTRPVIINLWGMTGTGKTDLVRKLVQLLGLQTRFAELDLSHSSNATYMRSIESELQARGLDDAQPGIVLFDELQHFATLDSRGNDVPDQAFPDYWELLSDGRIARRDNVSAIIESIFEAEAETDEGGKPSTTPKKRPRTKKRASLWDVRNLRRMCPHISMAEAAFMSPSTRKEHIWAAIQSGKVLEPIDYSKLLIINAGNLDSAYEMSHDTTDADSDADHFYAQTQRVGIMDIKRALSGMFRPEQVARFGNTHLIYRSLRATDFDQIITRELASLADRYFQTWGIQITFDASVSALIYRNGVFPAQGVRPVLSTLYGILSGFLAQSVFEWVAMPGKKSVLFGITYQDGHLTACLPDGQMIHQQPFEGELDRSRVAANSDAQAVYAVHEAGHALMYMLRYEIAPIAVKIRMANGNGGVLEDHRKRWCTAFVTSEAMVGLAGVAAERLVFGEEYATHGNANDLEKVTTMVARSVRDFGTYESFPACYTVDSPFYAVDRHVTDEEIIAWIGKYTVDTENKMKEYRPLLLALAAELLQRGTLGPDDCQRIAAAHSLTVRVMPDDHEIMAPYAEMLQKALETPENTPE